MSLLKPLSAFAVAAAASALVSVGWATGVGLGKSSSAVDQELPDLGSPATAAVSLEDEYRAGLGWFASMRQTGVVLEDPEVEDYIQEIGHSLSSRAEEGQHQFYYFVLKDPVVNAFAMPGGFIAIQSGLILATRNENELAGVMAHETAHVTQRHLVRQLIDQRHGRRHSGDSGRGDSAPDQLHAEERIRSRPHRHRHHGDRRLRSVGDGQL